MKTNQKQKNIPEGWSQYRLSKFISELCAGVSVNSVDDINSETKILKTSAVAGGIFDPRQSKDIAPGEIGRAKVNPKKGMILISRMNTPQLVGETALVKETKTKIFLPDRLWQTDFHKDADINTLFMAYMFNSSLGKFRIKSLATGTSGSMKNISKKDFLKLRFNFPPLPEQNRIIAVLETWDEAIEKLKRKIAIKKQIKKGLMQELLTGKTRLPGFDGEWKDTKIGTHLSIGSGKDYKHLSDGDVPVFGTGGFMLSVNEYLYEGPTVCIGRKGTIDKPFYHEGKIWTVDTLFFTHSHKELDPKFTYYYFLSIPWLKYNEASGVPSLSKKTIESIKISIPEIKEQKAIAELLTTADNEITALEQKLTLWQEQKKYLLNNLVTGQIRTPDNLLELIP